jgi:hypothetical protein
MAAAKKETAAKKKAAAKKKKAEAPAWIETLKAHLDLLRALGVVHQFGPRLAESKLAAFEKKHGLSLPRDYRDFLCHVGNGGPGPMEMCTLAPYEAVGFPSFAVTGTSLGGEVVTRVGTAPRPSLPRRAEMKRPFPLAAEWDTGTPLPLAEGAHPDGVLALFDGGCGFMALLVVTGPRAGEVWEDSTAAVDGGHLAPWATFRDFYEGWLRDQLRSAAGARRRHPRSICRRATSVGASRAPADPRRARIRVHARRSRDAARRSRRNPSRHRTSRATDGTRRHCTQRVRTGERSRASLRRDRRRAERLARAQSSYAGPRRRAPHARLEKDAEPKVKAHAAWRRVVEDVRASKS